VIVRRLHSAAVAVGEVADDEDEDVPPPPRGLLVVGEEPFVGPVTDVVVRCTVVVVLIELDDVEPRVVDVAGAMARGSSATWSLARLTICHVKAVVITSTNTQTPTNFQDLM
jgi:hypothetical protein